MLSQGRDNSYGLTIRSGASFTGLAYQYASSTEGGARIDNNGTTITGSLMVRQLRSSRLGPDITITYSEAAILSAIPDGFPGVATERSESWDDN